MKKIASIFFVLLTLAGISSAQNNSIPNAGFEDWGGSPENPNEWGVINFSFLTVINFTSATKSTDSHSGEYALQLESKSFSLPAPLPPIPIPPLPGAAIAGATTINPVTFTATNAGFPFSGHPTVLKGYYKYMPSGTDTGSVVVTLTRWNVDDQKRDTITSGVKYFRNTVGWYTMFSVPLIAYTDFPDTAMISIFSSPAGSPQNGSILLIDDLEFYPNIWSGAEEMPDTESRMMIFPNPGAEEITVELGATKDAAAAKITDMLGQTVFQTKDVHNLIHINTTTLSSGMYICSVYNNSGQQISVKKFTVNHKF